MKRIEAKTRKDKLVLLQTFLNLETGQVNEQAFEYENALYDKSVQMKALNARIRKCRLCEGLNIKRFTESCPGWGDLNAKVFFIGQSLHKPGVVSGVPFILGCGFVLDAALRLSGLLRKDVFITNVIHCHPENNRASTDEEKENCLDYLVQELSIVKPKLIVALGNDAKQALGEIFSVRRNTKRALYLMGLIKDAQCLYVKHPASFMYGAPEQRVDWILKLSLQIDKVYR